MGIGGGLEVAEGEWEGEGEEEEWGIVRGLKL